jgi:hypothetical protein
VARTATAGSPGRRGVRARPLGPYAIRSSPRAPCERRANIERYDKGGNLDEDEQEQLESSLQQRGWTYVGYTPSGLSGVAGVHRAERAGTRVVAQTSTSTAGLLEAIEAIEALERHEKASKEDVRDIHGEEDHSG